MKKRISLILCAVLVIAMAIVPMLALTASAEDNYSYTFSKALWTANGTKDAGGISWTLSGDGGYWGTDSNGKGQQFGSKGKPYKNMTLTSQELEGVTVIVIETSGASSIAASFTVSVGGTQLGSSTKLTSTSTKYTFTSDVPLNGAVEFKYTNTSAKAMYLKSLAITYNVAPAGDADCDHASATPVVVPPTCLADGYSQDVCDCGWKSEHYDPVDKLPHVDEDSDFYCDECDTFIEPAGDVELTIAQALVIAEAAGTSYTTNKYYITGTVTGLYNTTYGNLYLIDEDGNKICIYGLYSADGSARYDAMEVKPVDGDVIKVYTVLGKYGSTLQGKNANLIEHTPASCTNHVDNDGDYICDTDGCIVAVAPAAEEYLTLDKANLLGNALAGGYTEGKYWINGYVTEIVNAEYGNVWIEDDNGNKFYVYGLYNFDGSVSFKDLVVKPLVGDEISLYGIIGSYNGVPQMKNGWIDEIVHDCKYDANVTAPTCTADGYTTYTCACGDSYTEAGEPAKGHRYSKTQVVTFCEEEGYVLIECGNCGEQFDSRYDDEAKQYIIDLPFFNLAPQGHNYENGVCTKCQATIGAINEAQVNLGADLGVKWYVVLPEGADVADYVFTVEFLGESFVLEAVEADGRYMYFFANIAPQNMGDNMKATLALGENTVVVDNYSVKQNLLNIAAADATLETLVADLLNYGAAAQVYMEHNVDNLVNADVAFAGSADEIVNPGYTLEGNAKENSAYFKSANVLFASTNRVIVKVVVNTNATLVVGEKTYNLTAGEYEIYSRDIAATDLFDNVTFTLTGEDGNVTTLNYSVAAYAAAKAGNESAMGKLATALYYYAASIQDLVD